MRPTQWDHLSRTEKLRLGSELFASPRGKYVVSQALDYAVGVLKAAPEPQQEVSNREDMELLYETIFDNFTTSKDSQVVDLPVDSIDSNAA